jgi:hypothetical protein
MNTQKTQKTTKNFDDEILSAGDADANPVTISEPSARNAHSVYWVLRDKFGFSHIAAMLETYLLLRNTEGFQVKSWEDLQRPEIVEYINNTKDNEELAATMLSLHSENQDRASAPDEFSALLAAFELSSDDDDSDDSRS